MEPGLGPGGRWRHRRSRRGHLTGDVEWNYQRQAAESTVQVQDALIRVFHGEPRQVAVDVAGSHIVLRGKVRSWAELEAVYGAVWSAPGVLSVVNELTVEA